MELSSNEIKFNPHNKPTRFLILFVRGSGSTWLASLLNQQLYFNCGSETMLNEEFFATPSFDIQNLYRGYKNKIKHIPDWAEKKIIEENNVTMIFMFRRDTVRHAIGICRKKKLPPRPRNKPGNPLYKAGMGNAFSPDQIVPSGSISLNEFKQELDFIKEERQKVGLFHEKFIGAGIPILDIYYEDLLQDPTQVVRDVYEWITGTTEGFAIPVLNAPDMPVKNTSKDLTEVTNLEEVKQFVLAQTDLPWYE